MNKWLNFLPVGESQIIDGVDSMWCTAFATIDAIQILVASMGFERVDYEEWFTSYLAKSTIEGNDPQWVAKVIKNNGLYPREALLRVRDGLVTEVQRATARQWLLKYRFNYWVVKDISKALLVSPVGVAVHAWVESDGVYLDVGLNPNHWTLLVGEEKDWWLCWDSIEPNIKKISKDYKFSYALGYSVRARQGGLWDSIMEWIYGRLLLHKKDRSTK